MAINEKKPGRTETSYVLGIVTGEKAEISIFSGNETEKITYLKHFLEVNRDQDVFFVDNLTNILYNKNHIVSCKEKEEVNGQS